MDTNELDPKPANEEFTITVITTDKEEFVSVPVSDHQAGEAQHVFDDGRFLSFTDAKGRCYVFPVSSIHMLVIDPVEEA